MTSAFRTHDHEVVRKWVESRQGRPAIVRDTHHGNDGVLRIDFGSPEETLEPLTWEDFFRLFEEKHLDFLYQDEPDSRFFKLVDRE